MSPHRLLRNLGATFARLAPIAFAVLALVVLEHSAGPETPAVTEAGAAPAGHRLILFWVDSLALADMDPASPRMARLKARLPTGLHGPARQCADAVSVPCFTAMATGIDHFSLFSLAKNFGGVGRLPQGNVFQALQARGRTVGFIGDIMAKKAVEGFDWVEVPPTLDDGYTIPRALAQFDALKLDVVVVHIRETDVTTHTHGPDSPEYEAALEQADRLIDEAFRRYGPEVHIAVFGDHGHTDDGRHFAGLDVPTYASFFGPTFARRAQQPMVVTDYGALWARVFGLKFADGGWVPDYFAGRPLPQVDGLPDAPGGGSAPPLWALALVAALIVATAAPWQWAAHAGTALRPLLFGVAGLVLLMLALGLAWTTLRPHMSYLSRWVNVGLGLGFSAAGGLLLWPAWRAAPSHERVGPAALALLLAGAVLSSLPTVYKYGGVASGISALVLALGVGAALGLRARRWGAALAGALGIAVAWTLWNPAVRNFKVRWFSVFTEVLAGVIGPVALGLTLLAVGAALRPSPDRARPPVGPVGFGVGALVGLGLAFAVPHLPPRALILPCVATPVVLALGWSRPRLAPLALAVALPAYTFFFHADPLRIAPAAAALALWPLWARARAPHAGRTENAAALLLLVLTGLWALFGARISGIDFTYFFKWLPPGTAFKETWAQNATLTMALYVSQPCLGLLLARRVAPRAVDEALGLAWHLARGRLALALVFIVGFTASGGAGPFITSDVLQSAAVWGTTLLALLLAPGPGARAAGVGTGVAESDEGAAALASPAGGD
ncbi:MAG: alkaline phosphatase family protein [Myxococcales bacterium]|nr:alkaline phosphatase family protein [Myxococcales bacterium]